MHRRRRHRHGLEPRRQVHRPIVPDRVHPLGHGFVDERAFGDRPRFGVGDVAAEERVPLRPFLVLRVLGKELQQPPRAVQRVVQVSLRARRDIGVRAALALHAPGELVDGGGVDLEPGFDRLLDHPQQRIFRQPRFDLGVAAADIGMDAGEPDLPNVLRLRACGIEAVERKGLRLVPLFQAEHRAPLVDRDRLPEGLDARILQRPGQLLEARPVEPIRPRHDHAGHRIPDPDETNQRPPRRGDARELRGLVFLVGGRRFAAVGERLQLDPQALLSVRGKLLVGGEAAAGEIGLFGREQSDLVDQPRQHPHGVGAARKPEQVDAVAGLVMPDQEQVGLQHLVVEAIAGGQPHDGGEILHQLAPRVRPRQRADAGIVKHHLPRRLALVGLAQAAIELENVGNVLGDLVAGAVAEDDDVFHGGLAHNLNVYNLV